MIHGLKYQRIIFVCGLILLSGCTSHEINNNPAPNIALSVAGYPSAKSGEVAQPEEKNIEWWKDFKRSDLNQMVEKSFISNQDIIQAVARIKQARALAVNTGSALYPEVSIEGSSQGKWYRGNRQRGLSSIGGAAQWEFDLFGNLAAAHQADKLAAIASEEEASALKLSIGAEVADAYFGAVAAHKTLNLLRQQIKLDNEFLEIVEMQLKEGLGTTLELLQQQNKLAESEGLIPLANAELRVFENRLDVLLGEMPDAKNRVKPDDDLSFSHDLPAIGVPSDLLLNRPDLQQLKAELVAVDNDIAEAIAARLPRITLTGNHYFSDSSVIVGAVSLLTASFVQPLLDWGKRKAEVERNKYVYEEKLAEFTQLYLQAVEEVENASYREQQQRLLLQKLVKRKAIIQRALNGAKARYQQGVDDYLLVLTALQEMNKVERSLIVESLQLVNYRIALYRAIGSNVNSSNINKS